MAYQKLFDSTGFNILGAATRSKFREILAEICEASKCAPFRFVPAECASYLMSFFTAN